MVQALHPVTYHPLASCDFTKFSLLEYKTLINEFNKGFKSEDFSFLKRGLSTLKPEITRLELLEERGDDDELLIAQRREVLNARLAVLILHGIYTIATIFDFWAKFEADYEQGVIVTVLESLPPLTVEVQRVKSYETDHIKTTYTTTSEQYKYYINHLLLLPHNQIVEENLVLEDLVFKVDSILTDISNRITNKVPL